MIHELRVFLSSLTLLTCIPLPKKIHLDPYYTSQCFRYIPFAGFVISCLVILFLQFFLFILTLEVALLLTLICSVWITGGLHEDGLADFFDGLGAPHNVSKDKKRRSMLRIMRSPHIGLYGLLAVVFVFLFCYHSLLALGHQADEIAKALVVSHTLSRWISISILCTHSYVPEKGRIGFVLAGDEGRPKIDEICIASFFGLTPLFICYGLSGIFVFTLVLSFRVLFGFVLTHRLNGYNGDCLGAAQQLSFAVTLLGLTISI